MELRSITNECVEHLRELIRCRSVNPPGDELLAAQYLKRVFDREGIPSEVVEPKPGRGSVVARLKGDGSRRPLLMLSHLDVVPAVAKDWERDPFGGDLVDGEVWGRGAIDCKGATALWLAAIIGAKRLGPTPSRDIIFAATADEEMGGEFGVKWLAENRWDLIDAEFCLNEGAGHAVNVGGKQYFTYQTGEKGVCWFRLTATGTAGHASIPLPDNPVATLAEAVAKLGRAQLPVHITPTAAEFFRGLADAQGPEQKSLLLGVLDPRQTDQTLAQAVGGGYQAHELNAIMRNTAVPTVIRGGEMTNVIPSEASCDVDSRILPGQTPDDLIREVRALIGDAVELEITSTSPPTESAPRSLLADAIARALAKHSPESAVVPYLITGSTDGRYLRPRGMVVYGFDPGLYGADIGTCHGVDERVPVSSLEFGVKVIWDVLLDMAGLSV